MAQLFIPDFLFYIIFNIKKQNAAKNTVLM